jgi:NAD(P)-dependent dehydrogenase (short-subunit alcohol dehydrogenase family)
MHATSKTAIITGASSGIGKAAALKLQGAGYNVVLSARRETELQDVAKAASASGGRVLVIPCDVTDSASVAALFERTGKEFGHLDVLFNNAGIFAQGAEIDAVDYETWKKVVDVNINGMFLCAKEAWKMMKAQDPQGGRIINNGSLSAHNPRPLSAPYTTTKHAISGLTKSLSLDGRKYNIACSQIDIGNAATDFTARMATGILQANGSTMVEPRMDVEHCADAVLYIANLPLSANVQFMSLLATAMPYVGRG